MKSGHVWGTKVEEGEKHEAFLAEIGEATQERTHFRREGGDCVYSQSIAWHKSSLVLICTLFNIKSDDTTPALTSPTIYKPPDRTMDTPVNAQNSSNCPEPEILLG